MTLRFNLVLTSAQLKPLLRNGPNSQMWSLMLTLCIRKHIQVQVSEGDGIQHSAVKEIKKEYYRRVHMVLMTE